jgi:N-acetyl-alpha-D-muramate 1-phosphate uridylyltransferase
MRQFPVMLFAAGFGTRMGALTQTRPKALIEVAGRCLLDRALDLVDQAGFAPRVINVHHLGDQIERHVHGRDVAISREVDAILETGGGLRAALPQLGSSPVVTLNTDAVWTGQNALRELSAGWRDDDMDALLLLAPAAQAVGYVGPGDFVMDPTGRLGRAAGRPGLVYLGAQIIRTDLLASIPQEAFSLNLLWDRMIAKGRAFGVVHSGQWCDVGRPEGIAMAEAMLAQSGDD